jgi:hypothetical protein
VTGNINKRKVQSSKSPECEVRFLLCSIHESAIVVKEHLSLFLWRSVSSAVIEKQAEARNDVQDARSAPRSGRRSWTSSAAKAIRPNAQRSRFVGSIHSPSCGMS